MGPARVADDLFRALLWCHGTHCLGYFPFHPCPRPPIDYDSEISIRLTPSRDSCRNCNAEIAMRLPCHKKRPFERSFLVYIDEDGIAMRQTRISTTCVSTLELGEDAGKAPTGRHPSQTKATMDGKVKPMAFLERVELE